MRKCLSPILCPHIPLTLHTSLRAKFDITSRKLLSFYKLLRTYSPHRMLAHVTACSVICTIWASQTTNHNHQPSAHYHMVHCYILTMHHAKHRHTHIILTRVADAVGMIMQNKGNGKRKYLRANRFIYIHKPYTMQNNTHTDIHKHTYFLLGLLMRSG